MSSPGFDPCPAFEPGASVRFAALMVLSHGAAGLGIVVAQLPIWLKPALLAVVLCSAWRALRVNGWRTAGAAVVRVARRGDGRWELLRRDGRVTIGELHDDCYVHPLLAVVGVRDGWRTVFVPVPVDALRPDAHRRLRVWLRWSGQPAARALGGPGLSGTRTVSRGGRVSSR